jgi:hypothetical protein
MWLPDYYADILRGQDRMMLFNMRPEVNIRDDEGTPWYQSPLASLVHGRAMFYNSVIMLGRGTHLLVRNILKTDFGYQVDAVVSVGDDRQWGLAGLWGSEFWNAYKPGDAVTLLLHLDGDYLDIYTAGSNIHVGTYIRAQREFIVQYERLIRTNTSDLANVHWPRRADISVPFTPPVDMSGFSATHTTTARLRVRERATTDSSLVTTLDADTQVQVLETGAAETIGGITAPWVRVLSANGFSGWVFSGYLEGLAVSAAKDTASEEAAEITDGFQTNTASQSNDSTNSTPAWVWVAALCCAAILLAACIAAVLVKRKRSK